MTTYDHDIKGALLIAFWILLGGGVVWVVVYTAARQALREVLYLEYGPFLMERLRDIEGRLPPEKNDES